MNEDKKKASKINNCDNLNCILLHCLQHNIKQIPTASQVAKAFNNLLTKKKKIIWIILFYKFWIVTKNIFFYLIKIIKMKALFAILLAILVIDTTV